MTKIRCSHPHDTAARLEGPALWRFLRGSAAPSHREQKHDANFRTAWPVAPPPTKCWTTIIKRALAEDMGDGDLTSLNTIPAELAYSGHFLVKAEGVIAGLEVAAAVFATRLIPPCSFYSARRRRGLCHRVTSWPRRTGRGAQPVGRTCGAQPAAAHVGHRDADAALRRRRGGTGAAILDTRKTVPGLRLLDKWAVHLGGGRNHRIGLYDMALIKDNHIAAAGGITAAVAARRRSAHRPIEVEVTNLAQLREALALPIDRIMLDNMSLEMMRRRSASQRGSSAGGFGQREPGNRGRHRRHRGRFHLGRQTDPLGRGAGRQLDLRVRCQQ